MGALVAALFKDHATAEQVRVALVNDGFATDRVQLTSSEDLGPAALTPSEGQTDQLQDFFAHIFPEPGEDQNVREFVEGVRNGNAAVVVHPRGDIEVQSALRILNSSNPLQVREHDLQDQTMEQAASRASSTVVGKVVPEGLKTTINPRKN